MLFGALRDDYYLPAYLGPMVTFQMGVGSGYGIGVPPENHPSSWFAVIKGKKRWVLRPPDAGTSRSGGPGTEPPGVMQRWRDPSGLCMPASKPVDALHCDQAEGDVIWVPDYWWHEVRTPHLLWVGSRRVGAGISNWSHILQRALPMSLLPVALRAA